MKKRSLCDARTICLNENMGSFAVLEIIAKIDISLNRLPLRQWLYDAVRTSCIVTCWKLASF
jgi:hypothetical protein